MKAVKTIHDTVTIDLYEDDLTDMKVGEYLKTHKRDIPCSDGLKWWLRYYPAGEGKDCKNHLSVFLQVNQAVSVKDGYELNGEPLIKSCAHNFTAKGGIGYRQLASHDTLRQHFIDGELSITCNVEFSVTVPFSFLTTSMMRYSDCTPTDFEFIVGLDRVHVHKGYLSLISPVINAMLSHDTAESRSNTVKITDFDFETVKAAIDFCYGREPENLCVDTIIGILRFADKYDIQAVVDDLGEIPSVNLSIETFATIAPYASDCSKRQLFETCCSFFKEHQNQIITTPKFTTLTPLFVADLLKTAFVLETQFDVLRHANANRIVFILKPLELSIIEAMSLDTFCDTVTYAWECSRDDLKNACGTFFNDNQAEIRKMKEFYDLPPNVVYEVLKKGYDVL